MLNFLHSFNAQCKVIILVKDVIFRFIDCRFPETISNLFLAEITQKESEVITGKSRLTIFFLRKFCLINFNEAEGTSALDRFDGRMFEVLDFEEKEITDEFWFIDRRETADCAWVILF